VSGSWQVGSGPGLSCWLCLLSPSAPQPPVSLPPVASALGRPSSASAGVVTELQGPERLASPRPPRPPAVPTATAALGMAGNAPAAGRPAAAQPQAALPRARPRAQRGRGTGRVL